jgi:hypothetical protein
VGVWAPRQPEPWWLATTLADPVVDIVACYDRRMAIEEPCRDTKGRRFGVRREWTPFRTPADLARFTLLIGVAWWLWTTVGQAVVHVRPHVRRPCKRKGPRLSRLRVGIPCVPQLAPLISLGIRFIRAYLPPLQLRRFPWLQALEGVS